MTGAFATAVAFAIVLQVSIAGEYRSTRPTLALAVAPGDAEARARLAATLARQTHAPEALEPAMALAHDALRRSPLIPAAVRALGLVYGADGSDEGQVSALTHMKLAERLSRRDQATQLWLAEHHLRRGNIPEVIRQFDIALRTSLRGQRDLFPLLAAAASDERIAEALVTRMRAKPHWAFPFARHLLRAPLPNELLVSLYQRTLDPKIPAEMELIQFLMQRFASAGEYRLVRQLHDDFDLGANSSREFVRNGSFEESTNIPPFGWDLAQEPELWAASERQPDGGKALGVFAAAGSAGEAARQLVELSPGSYSLSADFSSVPTASNQYVDLQVRCAEANGLKLVTLTPASGTDMRRVSDRFTVPQSCAFQWLVVNTVGPEAGATGSRYIDDVVIARE
ncbi:hypothetical protein GRI75_01290 [Altererythrobacter soli]|uniref:Uncharacterized protein n=1 Tax=Croceibacterium soli TaxID=1739690 RepID=A0A6I4URW5_9SPHN|nr:hypothetical protein [Croceibacterium soli]MXP40277.1 hypothetical protein [Croceibacterium soli]